MDNDLVGQRYVATGASSTKWVVTDELSNSTGIPHVRLHMSGDPSATKLIALNALMDEKLYRRVE